MRDYGITYLFHDRRARANMGLPPTNSAINWSMIMPGHASAQWVMGRYLTVLRDRPQKEVMR